MTGRLVGALAALLTVVGMLGGAMAVAPAAQAADTQVGTLAFVPPTGTNLTGMHVVTSRGCPANADAYYMRVTGKGLPAEGQIVTENTSAGLSRTDPFPAYFLQIMRDYVDDNGGGRLGGPYQATLYCIDSFTQKVWGTFTGTFEFVSPTKYVTRGTNSGTPEPLPITDNDARRLPDGSIVPAASASALAARESASAKAKASGSGLPTATASPGATSAIAATAGPSTPAKNRGPLVVTVLGMVLVAAAGLWFLQQRKGRTPSH